MAEKLSRQQIARVAAIHAQPPVAPAATPAASGVIVDRSFELPTVLYGATVGLFLGFIGVMGAGFANPNMILPVAIFVFFVVAGFGVPAIWTRMQPDHPQRAVSWARFQSRGIQTYTGHCPAGTAVMQVLILPALIFLWGVAVVSIAAWIG